MNADEFSEVLRDVIRDELGVADVELGARWKGGEVVMISPARRGRRRSACPSRRSSTRS